MSGGPRWTAEQVVAITSTRHTLLAAGAGTGKTTTLIGKILWHLGLGSGMDRESGLPLEPCPEEHRCGLSDLVAITFTEKAAYDLRRKLREALEGAAPELLWELDRAAIGTIHSFCAGLLREHAFRFGIDPGFSVLDERASRLELAGTIRELILRRLADGDPRAERLIGDSTSLDGWEHTAGPIDLVEAMLRDVRWHGDRHQQWLLDGTLDAGVLRAACREWDAKDDALLERLEGARSLAAEALERWREYLEEENSRDFDALVLDCRDLLASEEGGPALEGIRARTRLLIIDEFQDTDGAQRDIAFLIAGLAGRPAARAPRLFLVGDPKQSIYGFRGADIAVWNEVRERLSEFGPPLELSGNFRSDPAVVGFANRACSRALGECAGAIEGLRLSSAVAYSELRAEREAKETGAVEWLAVGSGSADARRKMEAEAIAARIRHLVIDPALGDTEGGQIVDPETGAPRDCQYRDVAILFRARTGLDLYAQELARYGIPFYLAGDAGLTDRLEIADLLNLLRLVANPLDDLAAFTYMRSPFVGLRDEVLARMRLANPVRPLLYQAPDFLDARAWFEAPEHPRVGEVERDALREGLDLVRDLIALRSRIPIDQLATIALERSGYPLHILLLPQPEPRLANLSRFVRVLEGYRDLALGAFLELWDKWEDKDLGIPQAPLYSRRDNVVTISTIHAAKGLEWPVVVLAGMDSKIMERLGGVPWTDRELGPVMGVKKDDRGPRAAMLCARKLAEEEAEEARLVYVAATRARDRLIVGGRPEASGEKRAGWLWAGVDATVEVRPGVQEVERPPLPPEPVLAWLDDIVEGAGDPALVLPLRRPRTPWTRSASELMAFRRNRKEWRLVYEHGVMPRRFFLRDGADGSGVPAAARGTVIHKVLEEIEDAAELAELLDVAVGALDAPELEDRLGPGTAAREEIEAEITRVLESEEWRGYVEGEHRRELRFVQFRGPRRWYVGAFDLWRPGEPEGLIVDFKTQQVVAGRVEAEARKYRLQALVYRAVMKRFGRPCGVRFHFTGPNEAVRSAGPDPAT